MTVLQSGLDNKGALSGPARVLYAPTSVAIPAKLGDIIALVGVAGVYAPITGWLDFGYAADASSLTRSFEEEGQEYEQTVTDLFKKITSIERGANVNMAEIDPEVLQIIEQAPAIATIAASANNSAQKQIKFGSFETVTKYRIAMISQRDPGAVLVTEPGGTVTRGGLVCSVLYRAGIAADEAELSIAKGDPTNVDVAFVGEEEPGQADGVEYGTHFIETAGVIA